MKAAILYTSLAPFHFARLNRAATEGHRLGAELHCIEIARSQSNYSWEEFNSSSTAFDYLTLFECDYFALKPRSIFRAVSHVLSEINPDVVVINGWGHTESSAAFRWCSRNRVPRVVISDSQSIDSPRHWWKERLKRAFVSRCHAGFAGGSPHVRYLQSLGLPSGFCVVGCDVVDNDVFIASKNGSRGTPAEIRILSCLRFLSTKNIPRALRSLSELNFPWRWTLAGDGPERENIIRCIESLGLKDRVRLLGHVPYEQLPEIYTDADVYLQPSFSEPWALAVNEAMASGLPVVVSDRCGCHEDLVRRGVNGYTFDPLVDESLRQAMKRIWQRRNEWSQMGDASREIVEKWSLNLFATNLWRACKLALIREEEERLGNIPKHRTAQAPHF